MIKLILLTLSGVVGVLAVVIALRPAEFVVQRSTTIAAPPHLVFEQVNDFRQWRTWSPWERIDPQLERVYEGPRAGVGSRYVWTGNRQVGAGWMTIVDSTPAQRVGIKLEFLQPFAATNDAQFLLTPEAVGTRVTWRMSGRNNFAARAVGLFMDMDRMVGGQFEQGLANLKQIAEGSQKNGPP